LTFLFLLDGDKQGKAERDRYQLDFGISIERLATIDELVSGVKVIEDLLDSVALDAIQNELGLMNSPTKGQIRRFFQERLASGKVDGLGAEFAKRSKGLLKELHLRLAAGGT